MGEDQRSTDGAWRKFGYVVLLPPYDVDMNIAFLLFFRNNEDR